MLVGVTSRWRLLLDVGRRWQWLGGRSRRPISGTGRRRALLVGTGTARHVTATASISTQVRQVGQRRPARTHRRSVNRSWSCTGDSPRPVWNQLASHVCTEAQPCNDHSLTRPAAAAAATDINVVRYTPEGREQLFRQTARKRITKKTQRVSAYTSANNLTKLNHATCRELSVFIWVQLLEGPPSPLNLGGRKTSKILRDFWQRKKMVNFGPLPRKL